MMKAQLENGHTRIANDMEELLAKLKISNYESRFLWALFRKTYGFQKKEDRIALSQFSKMTNISSQHIARTKKKLLDKNIIFQHNGKIGIQTELSKWVLPNEVLPKQVRGTTQTGSKTLPKQVDTKEKKETIQKKEANQFLEFYNETRKEKRKSIKTWYSNFIIWREVYSLEEMKRAISKANHSVFFDSAMNPDLFFRTKNKNGQCDYIGDLLNTKSKELLEYEKEIEGIKIIKE